MAEIANRINGVQLPSQAENKGGEYGRVRHADCRDAYPGRTPYTGDDMNNRLEFTFDN
ncbi:MAG: hypothetical protein KH111_16210 [Bacteroidales bacterium]|nr:hypothetical protein [Bacteroidales bacterium]